MSSSARGKKATSGGDRRVWSEFGTDTGAAGGASERPELPPERQRLRLQVSRQGRKGKTVTIVSGFQAKPETLSTLLKQLKAHCGAGGALKDATLEIQGDHREKLRQKLQQLGYKI